MNDWQYFFNHVDDYLANSTYRIFEEQSKTEILAWFSREDVAKEQKEDFIQALVEFKDDCGDFYHYRAYLLAAEALNYFKDCSRGDAIASTQINPKFFQCLWLQIFVLLASLVVEVANGVATRIIRAIALAKIVISFGLDYDWSGKGCDRT